jgi:hypothetical protein
MILQCEDGDNVEQSAPLLVSGSYDRTRTGSYLYSMPSLSEDAESLRNAPLRIEINHETPEAVTSSLGDDAGTNIGTTSDETSVRKVVGTRMHNLSQAINDNLIAARYGAMAGIFLLTAYGLSNTPLFFRFRIISEIPGKSAASFAFCYLEV